jgi:hypothetical protein
MWFSHNYTRDDVFVPIESTLPLQDTSSADFKLNISLCYSELYLCTLMRSFGGMIQPQQALPKFGLAMSPRKEPTAAGILISSHLVQSFTSFYR